MRKVLLVFGCLFFSSQAGAEILPIFDCGRIQTLSEAAYGTEKWLQNKSDEMSNAGR